MVLRLHLLATTSQAGPLVQLLAPLDTGADTSKLR